MQHAPGFLQIVADAKTRVREVTIDDVLAKLQQNASFTLIDVREESEWNAGRLPRAIHIGKGVIERDIEARAPRKDEEILLYCGGGYRSALAADALQKMGYTNVCSVDGGFRAWKLAGCEIVQ